MRAGENKLQQEEISQYSYFVGNQDRDDGMIIRKLFAAMCRKILVEGYGETR